MCSGFGVLKFPHRQARCKCGKHRASGFFYVVHLTCEAPDLELLFVEWLNAIIYEMAVRNMLFGRFLVELPIIALK